MRRWRDVGFFRAVLRRDCQGQPNPELAALATAGAARSNFTTVQFDQRACERQAKAQASRRLGLARIQLNEHLENAVQIRGRNSDAVISHADEYVLCFGTHRYFDASVARSELRRIVQQVCDNLRETDRVPIYIECAGGVSYEQLM